MEGFGVKHSIVVVKCLDGDVHRFLIGGQEHIAGYVDGSIHGRRRVVGLRVTVIVQPKAGGRVEAFGAF